MKNNAAYCYFAGEYSDMAGGIINDITLFDEKRIYNNFMELLL